MTAYELLAKNLEDIQVMLKYHGCLLNSLKEGGDTPLLRQCVSAFISARVWTKLQGKSSAGFGAIALHIL